MADSDIVSDFVSSSDIAHSQYHYPSTKSLRARQKILDSDSFRELDPSTVKQEPDTEYCKPVSTTNNIDTHRFDTLVQVSESRLFEILRNPNTEYGELTVQDHQYEVGINNQILHFAERHFQKPVLLPEFVSHISPKFLPYYHILTEEEHLSYRHTVENNIGILDPSLPIPSNH